jgi:hypothetical protein
MINTVTRALAYPPPIWRHHWLGGIVMLAAPNS